MNDLNKKKYYSDDLHLKELFSILWSNKKFILLVISLFSLASIFYSLSLPNIYTAETVLSSASKDPVSGLTSQYSGLASLAGINLPSGNDSVEVAIALVRSKRLVAKLMRGDDFLPNLLAVKKWDMSSGEIIYDQSRYDVTNKKWVRKYASPFQQTPSVSEAFKKFSKIVSISQNQQTELITVTVSHHSPVIAQKWALDIVREVNNIVANMIIIESQNTINFLNEQIKITPYAELRTRFFELIQKSTQDMMLVKVNPEHALSTIDPPLIPEMKSKPNRAMICILVASLGSLIAVLIILIRHYIFNQKNELRLFDWW